MEFGDGYKHRATRGLNPVRPTWALNFPFTSQAELTAYDQFLTAYATGGFWMRPPDSTVDVFVTADEWVANLVDRNKTSGIVGSLAVTFAQTFNPQQYDVVDPDLAAWKAAVIAKGGTVSYAQSQRIDTMIRTLKATGIWPKLDFLFVLAAENSQQRDRAGASQLPVEP